MYIGLPPAGYSNMKVTGMCLPANENRGCSVKDFVDKRGSLDVGSKKGGLFWFEFPKIGVNLV